MPASSIYLCGLEQLEIWLKRFPEVAREADLDPVDSPLIVSPDDLAALLDDPPTGRVTYEQKNALNNTSAEYAKAQLQKYLKETTQIRVFLAAPENHEVLCMYKSAADEFDLKIIANRKDYQTFDKVMEYLVDLLFNRDPVLRQHGHKRLTRAVLFYMYWNCDIGEEGDAAADQALSS